MGLIKFIKSKATTKAHSGVQTGAIFDMFRHDQPAELTKKAQLAMFYTSPAFYGALLRVADSCASVERKVSVDGEVVEEHPILELIERPNHYMSGHVYRIVQQLYREIVGESFAVPMEQTESRRFDVGDLNPNMQLVPIPPTAVDLENDRWRVRWADKDVIYEMDELFWQKGLPDLRRPLGRGIGFGDVLADELQADEFAARFESSFFLNGAKPEFIISLLGSSDDRADTFEQRWKQRFQGPQKGFQPVIFNSEDINAQLPEITELTQRFKDVGVSKFREWEHEIIRRTIGVPPEVMGIVENSNRATIESAELIMAKYVVTPRCKQWEDDWNTHIVPLFDPSGRTQVHAKVPMPEDKEHTRTIMKNHKEAFTVNEIRKAAGQMPRSDGEVYMRLINGSLVAVPAGDVRQEIRSISQDRPVIKLKSIDGGRMKVQEESTEPFVFKAPGDGNLVAREADINVFRKAADDLKHEMRSWAQLEAETLGLERVPPGVEQEVHNYVTEFAAERITDINNTTRESIRDIIDIGQREGKTFTEIESELAGMFEGAQKHRARTIARTEMSRAANRAKVTTQDNSGVVRGRQWLVMRDDGTRDAHRELDGEMTGPKQPFSIPRGEWAGATAMHPCDFGIVELDVNCRCTVVATSDKSKPAIPFADKEQPEDAVDTAKQLWKSFDRRLSESEERFESSVREAFKRQWEEHVQPAVRRVLGEEAA